MYLGYIHSFRGLAILMIVSGHVLPWGLFGWDGSEWEYEMVRTFLRNDTIAFVFISGFLFQHLAHKFEVKRYYLSKFKFVLLPYLVVCIPAILKMLFVDGGAPYENASPFAAVLYTWYYGTGQQYLWYIPMITVVFLLGVPLNKYGSKPGFYACLPVLIILSLFLGRGPNPWHNAAYFLSIYVLGMWVRLHLDAFHLRFRSWLVPSILVSTGLYCLEIWLRLNRPDLPLALALSYLRWAIGCLIICWLFKKYEERLPEVLGSLATLSFGIFFIHGYAISAVERILARFGLHQAPKNLLMVLLGIVVITGLTSLVLVVIKKVTGKKSRYLVGC